MADNVHWEGVTPFVERQTKRIEKDFGRSKPVPRLRKMGFKPDPNKVRLPADDWRVYLRADSW